MDHHSNVIIMKKFEILSELSKWDTEIQSEQILLEIAPIDLLDSGLPQTNLLKNVIICETQ